MRAGDHAIGALYAARMLLGIKRRAQRPARL